MFICREVRRNNEGLVGNDSSLHAENLISLSIYLLFHSSSINGLGSLLSVTFYIFLCVQALLVFFFLAFCNHPFVFVG